MPLTGHCLCKAVTYTADVDAPLVTGYDHCDDCQRQSGSTYCKLSFHPQSHHEVSYLPSSPMPIWQPRKIAQDPTSSAS